MNPNSVTLDGAIRFCLDFGHSTNTNGNSTDDKYDALYEGRMKPYRTARGVPRSALRAESRKPPTG
jgi:hypothetical protein